MSVINQMLRDLDARGAASPGEVPVGSGTVEARRPAGRMTVSLLLVLAAGGASYLAWSSRTGAGALPARVERAEAQATGRLPVAMASPVRAEPGDRPSPGKPAVASAAPKISAPPNEKAPGAGIPGLAIQDASGVSGAAQTEPAVIKKMAELAPEAEAQQCVDAAQALRRAGEIDAAIGKYRQALERYPGMRNARIQLAALLQESGNADAALSVLRAGYELQPDDRLAIAAGRLLADQGQRDEALNWLARARGGWRPADHALMGALLSQAQRYEDAVTAYRQALAADAQQGGWLLGLGLALEALGRADEARAAYRDALGRGGFKPDVIRFLQRKTGTSES